MAKKKATKKMNISREAIARTITVVVTLVVGAGLIVTAFFVYGVLKQMSGASFRLSEEDAEAIETIDLDKLSELRAKIDEKNRLDEARAGRLRNPFAPPEPEPEPEPVTTPPAEESNEPTPDVPDVTVGNGT